MAIDTMSSEKIDTRTRILKATWSLLEDNVAKLPRMSDIAKAAGVSRQALYLHFPSRTELLIETTRYQDQTYNVDERLAASRSAPTGRARLDAFVTAWCNYVPQIWNVGRALLVLAETEPEAADAINQRMSDIAEGFEAAVLALARDGDLPSGVDTKRMTELLCALLSFRTWEMLTQQYNWPHDQYLKTMQALARAATLGGTNELVETLLDSGPPPP